MYKRDYELIAATIKGEIADVNAKLQDPRTDSASYAHLQGVKGGCIKLAHSLVEKFRLDNPLFDPAKFLKACNV